MIDTIEEAPDAARARRLPSGWYDPDSSSFEMLEGAAAVNDAMAGSLKSDRTIDAATDERDDADARR
jgi:hypothetical protein